MAQSNETAIRNISAAYNAVNRDTIALTGPRAAYRDFNNFVKSECIHHAVTQHALAFNTTGGLAVIDLCCGRGGDVPKWIGVCDALASTTTPIKYIIFADVASKCVKNCETRWQTLSAPHNRRWGANAPHALFFTADCFAPNLPEQLSTAWEAALVHAAAVASEPAAVAPEVGAVADDDGEAEGAEGAEGADPAPAHASKEGTSSRSRQPPPLPPAGTPLPAFDLISCQFAFHYATKSIDAASAVFVNTLRPLLKDYGLFFGTTTTPSALAAAAAAEQGADSLFAVKAIRPRADGDGRGGFAAFSVSLQGLVKDAVDGEDTTDSVVEEFEVDLPLLAQCAAAAGLYHLADWNLQFSQWIDAKPGALRPRDQPLSLFQISGKFLNEKDVAVVSLYQTFGFVALPAGSDVGTAGETLAKMLHSPLSTSIVQCSITQALRHAATAAVNTGGDYRAQTWLHKRHNRTQRLSTFPGSHVIGIWRTAVKHMRSHRVSMKTDGERVWVIVLPSSSPKSSSGNDRPCDCLEAWVLDRRMRLTPIHFSLSGKEGITCLTIIDGELIAPGSGEAPNIEPRPCTPYSLEQPAPRGGLFVAFDVISAPPLGPGVAGLIHEQRMDTIAPFAVLERALPPAAELAALWQLPTCSKYQSTIAAQKSLFPKGGIPDVVATAAVVIQKRQFFIQETLQLLTGLPSSAGSFLPHNIPLFTTDGLVFTANTGAYALGGEEHLLKWKGPNHRTCDVQLTSFSCGDVDVSNTIPLCDAGDLVAGCHFAASAHSYEGSVPAGTMPLAAFVRSPLFWEFVPSALSAGKDLHESPYPSLVQVPFADIVSYAKAALGLVMECIDAVLLPGHNKVEAAEELEAAQSLCIIRNNMTRPVRERTRQATTEGDTGNSADVKEEEEDVPADTAESKVVQSSPAAEASEEEDEVLYVESNEQPAAPAADGDAPAHDDGAAVPDATPVTDSSATAQPRPQSAYAMSIAKAAAYMDVKDREMAPKWYFQLRDVLDLPASSSADLFNLYFKDPAWKERSVSSVVWVPLRCRRDKDHANDIAVVQSTVSYKAITAGELATLVADCFVANPPRTLAHETYPPASKMCAPGTGEDGSRSRRGRGRGDYESRGRAPRHFDYSGAGRGDGAGAPRGSFRGGRYHEGGRGEYSGRRGGGRSRGYDAGYNDYYSRGGYAGRGDYGGRRDYGGGRGDYSGGRGDYGRGDYGGRRDYGGGRGDYGRGDYGGRRDYGGGRGDYYPREDDGGRGRGGYDGGRGGFRARRGGRSQDGY